jgi:hypothetical protein
MLMNKSISLETVDLEKSLPVRRNSDSDISKKGKFPPLPVRKSKLSLLRKVIPHRYSTRSTVSFQNKKLIDIGIPKSSPTIKKPSRWERTKAAIYKSPSLLAKTLSILQRTLSSPTPSEADSPKVLTENPLVELPTSLYPSLTAGPADRPSISLIFARAEDCLTQVDSDSDSDESETELGKEVGSILNKPDESTKQTEIQLFTEPGVRGGRSVRPRTSTRIQIVSDDSIQDNLVEIEKCGSELSNNEEGNTASRVQIVGSSNEASARIPLSASPVIPYNSQPCPSGDGENPSYHL